MTDIKALLKEAQGKLDVHFPTMGQVVGRDHDLWYRIQALLLEPIVTEKKEAGEAIDKYHICEACNHKYWKPGDEFCDECKKRREAIPHGTRPVLSEDELRSMSHDPSKVAPPRDLPHTHRAITPAITICGQSDPSHNAAHGTWQGVTCPLCLTLSLDNQLNLVVTALMRRREGEP